MVSAGKVAIVIATHQQCYPLDRCIKSHSAMLDSSANLVFVDNGSGGVLTEWAKTSFPDITVISRTENGFFCGGYNSGMQYAIDNDYQYVLIVNADTEVDNPDYISKLIDAAERHPDVAFAGPKVFQRESGNVQNTVLLYPWFIRYMLSWVISPFTSNNRSRDLSEDTKVEFLNGVCVLCRISALRKIGLLDEIMGGYVEDTDWSWRARKLGWNSLYVPVPSIIHHQPKNEYEHYSLKSFMLRRNHVYWHIKEGRRVQAFLFAYSSLALAWIRATKASLIRQHQVEHWRYVRRYYGVVRGILNDTPVGQWFGPPKGRF